MASGTRDRLMHSAYELFSRDGFHGVGLDRVLDEVGVSKQTFYNHFESKEDLMLAVLHHRSRYEIDTMQQALRQHGGLDPAARLYALWDVLDEWFNRDEFRGCIFLTAAVEFPSVTEPAHQAASVHCHALQDMLSELATLAGARAPQTLAENLMVLMNGALVVRHVMGSPNAAFISRRNAEMLLKEHLPQQQKPSAMSARRASKRPRAVLAS
jgi:AcrR family transcriptional regulator